jgi:hypothetical protein
MAPAPKVWERKLYQSLSEWNSGRFSYKKEGFGKISGKYLRYTDRTKPQRGEAVKQGGRTPFRQQPPVEKTPSILLLHKDNR